LRKSELIRTANLVLMATLKAPFGEFRGKKKHGCTQYLGIKYASLKDQLAIPEMVKKYGSEVIDATEFG
jgi:carboxylesterase type B